MNEPSKTPDNPKLPICKSATVESASIFSKEEIPSGHEVKRLHYWWAIVVPLLIVAFVSIPFSTKPVANLMLSYWDMHDIGESLVDYIKESDQSPPILNNWCEVILKTEDGQLFSRTTDYETNKVNLPYILNKHVLGLKEIPDDMVLLFIGNPGWNQVGDFQSAGIPELAKVLYANGEKDIFRKSQLPYLRWKLEDSGVFPDPDVKKPLMIMISLLGIVFLSVLIYCHKSLKTFWLFALVMGMASGAVGVYLSILAEEAYYKKPFTSAESMAPQCGIWMFIIGICFVGVIGKIYKKYNGKVKILGYSTVIGIITGITASAIVHGYLMITYNEPSFTFMVPASLSFGSIAGFVLGWISSGVIKLYKMEQCISKPNEELT